MSSKFTKALVAALTLVSVSVGVASTASAAAHQQRGWTQDGYMTPRHDPTDTNGF